MLDIERLHKLYFNEDRYGRRAGHTTLFVWQLIGIAEVDCFSYLKIQDRILIPFNKPVQNVLNIIEVIEKTCRANDIDFSINDSYRFTIKHTVFEFFRWNDAIESFYEASRSHRYVFQSQIDNDALYKSRELTDESTHIRMLQETVKGCSIIAMKVEPLE